MALSVQLVALLGIGLACGVAGDDRWVRWAPYVAAGAVAASLLAHPRDQRWLRRSLAGAAVAAVAVVHGSAAVGRVVQSPLREWAETHAGGLGLDAAGGRSTRVVTIEGRLVRDAATVEDGALLQVAVTRVGLGEWLEPTSGGVSLHVGGALIAPALPEWRGGRPVRMPVVLRRPARYLNAGVPDAERSAQRRGFTLSGTVKSAALVEVLGRGRWWDETAAAVRARVRAVMGWHVAPYDSTSAAIGTAILIGDRASLTPEIERRLQEAGTYHVVAISGGNIALLAGALLAVLWVLRIRFAVAAAIVMAVLVAHGWTIGGGVSVVRATVMAVIYLALRLRDLGTTPLNAIAVGAALMLVADPLEIVAAGFWLTFGATVALVALASRWRWTPRPWWRAPAAICLGTLAVEAVLAPISALVFQRVTLAGLALNLVAVPCMAVVQASASVAVAMSVAGWPGGADLAGVITHLASVGLIESARLVDLAPWSTWRVPSPSHGTLVAYYATLLAWWAASRSPLDSRVRRVSARATAVVAAGLWLWIAVAPATLARAGGDGRLHLTVMDVGQGDALLAVFPNGRTLMVDSGGLAGAERFDMGDRVIGPALRARGLTRLDYLALTHSHPDHIGGALSLTREFAPIEIWAGLPVADDEPAARLEGQARLSRTAWRSLQRGDRLRVDEVEVRVHHPPFPDWERRRVRNDDSLVLELRYVDVGVLLTGDVTRGVEVDLLPLLDPLPLTILKAPHHGSATSSSVELLRRLRPRIVLVSAGRGNLFGHPAPIVLERYASLGAQVFRTDLDGQIDLVTDGRSVDVHTFTGREWRMP
jgi:competence protein ComEC